MRTHNTGVVSSMPPCVTFKTPLARKVTGNHLLKSTSLEKTHNPVWFLLLSKLSMRCSLLVNLLQVKMKMNSSAYFIETFIINRSKLSDVIFVSVFISSSSICYSFLPIKTVKIAALS